MTTEFWMTNSFSHSKSETESNWDYDDVNSLSYGISIQNVGAPLNELTFRKEQISMRESARTADTECISDSFRSLTTAAHVEKDPATARYLLSSEKLAAISGIKSTSTFDTKSVVSSITCSIPSTINIESGHSRHPFHKKKGKNIHPQSHNVTKNDSFEKEPSIPNSPNQEALEDLYEQLRRQSGPFGEDLGERNAYRQPRGKMHGHQSTRENELPSAEDEWRLNFQVPNTKKKYSACRREDFRPPNEAAFAKEAARRKRAIAARVLLSKSASTSMELGSDLDDGIGSDEHLRSVLSHEDDLDQIENADFWKADYHDHGELKQNSAEIIRLDGGKTSSFGTRQKRRGVFYRFLDAGWKALSFPLTMSCHVVSKRAMKEKIKKRKVTKSEKIHRKPMHH